MSKLYDPIKARHTTKGDDIIKWKDDVQYDDKMENGRRHPDFPILEWKEWKDEVGGDSVFVSFFPHNHTCCYEAGFLGKHFDACSYSELQQKVLDFAREQKPQPKAMVSFCFAGDDRTYTYQYPVEDVERNIEFNLGRYGEYGVAFVRKDGSKEIEAVFCKPSPEAEIEMWRPEEEE